VLQAAKGLDKAASAHVQRETLQAMGATIKTMTKELEAGASAG
jgi:hypothetical protein